MGRSGSSALVLHFETRLTGHALNTHEISLCASERPIHQFILFSYEKIIQCFSSQLLKGKSAYFQHCEALEVLFGNISNPPRNKKLPDLIKIKFATFLPV